MYRQMLTLSSPLARWFIERSVVVMNSEVSAGGDLVERVGPFWSSGKVVEALALQSPEALHELALDGSVLELTTSDGQSLFPVWQFHRTRGTVVEVLPALLPLFVQLRQADPWSVAQLAVLPADELEGQTPLEVARGSRDPQCLSDFAAVVAVEWGRD
jgi:hypothetical protein